MTEQNTGWRDISTAPLDGTVVLVREKDGCVYSANFCPVEESWKLADQDGMRWNDDLELVAHWQPLPPPPGEEASRKDWRKLACDAADRVEHLQEERDTLQARCDELRDELYQLKLLICGGEGEPEGANMLTLRDADEIEDRLDALRPVVDGGSDE